VKTTGAASVDARTAPDEVLRIRGDC